MWVVPLVICSPQSSAAMWSRVAYSSTLPHVVGDAPALIKASGLADRIRIEAGNFFESIPSGGDAYLFSTSSTIGARPNA